MATTAFTLPPPSLSRRTRICKRTRSTPLCEASHNSTQTRPIFAEIKPAIPGNLLSRITKMHEYPTITQLKALPTLLDGKDVLLHAPTGTGKTLCYLITCLARINPSRASAQALIVVPSTELGAQVLHVLQKLSDLPYALLLDDDKRGQRMALRKGPRVVLGTPVRVWGMRRFLRLDLVRIMVIDEFDACLGRSEDTRAVVSILGSDCREGRQTILCSATVPQHRHFLKRGVSEGWLKKGVVHIRGEDGIVIPEGIQHCYVMSEQDRKIEVVGAVVRRFKGQIIVFTSEARDIDEVVDRLNGIVEGGVVGIRREWSAGERRHVMKKFREGVVKTLVATDVAARGIDLPNAVGVLQMDLPRDSEGYLHRAGRVGRMGRRGWSVLIITEGERFVVERFENVLGINFKAL